MSRAYYNEFDPKAASWLRELIKAGLIAPGDVDERSITDVSPTDLVDYNQCHFFAGIGGWSYALRLAGIPDEAQIWTGSCPCQPFSAAGKGKGVEDERHLWPAFARLIDVCRPSIVFGEQVASKAGRQWLSGVRTDLEGMAYAVGAADLCASSVGAPHIRQRLFWVAHAKHSERRKRRHNGGNNGDAAERPHVQAGTGSAVGGMVLANGAGSQPGRQAAETARHGSSAVATGGAGAWSDFYLIRCGDGKTRRVGSGLFPLANGVHARVGRLRGYGNAIVPQVAAEFIQAALEAISE